MHTTEAVFLSLLFSGILALLAGLLTTSSLAFGYTVVWPPGAHC